MSRATIKTHFKHLAAPYRPRPKAASIIASAKKLAHLILSSGELLAEHRKKMLKEVLWLITEADGKYSTRYRSKEVVRLAQKQKDCQVAIRHEHVFPRAVVATTILAREPEFRRYPKRLDKLLDDTVGCVVTVEEHGRLLRGESGWKRYRHVPVLDMSTLPPKRLKQ